MRSSKRFVAFIAWFIASLFYAYQYVLRVMPNIMIDDIMDKFKIDTSLFGQFSGVYYIGYSLMHIPVGILLDRVGAKIIMPIFILLTTLGLLPIIYTDIWVYPTLGRFIVGIGSSASVLGLFKVVRANFPKEKFGRMIGITVTIGLIGAIYGGGPINYLKLTLGFDNVIKFLVAIGVALAIISFIFIPKQDERQENGSIVEDLKYLMLNWRVITLCLLAGLMVGPLEGFADAWGATFLEYVYGFSKQISSSLTSIIFLAMCFGAPLISVIAEKIGRHVLIIKVSSIVMAASFILLLSGLPGKQIIGLLFVLIGVFSAYQIVVLHKVSTYVDEKRVGLATAAANMIIMIFGYLFHSSIGKIVSIFSSHSADKVVYTSQSLIYGVSIIPITLIISSLGLFYFALVERKVKKMVMSSKQ